MTGTQLRELGVRRCSRVGLEMDIRYLKTSTYRALGQALPEAQFVDVTSEVIKLRTIKSPTKIESMRQAANFSDIKIKAAIDSLRPDIREGDLLLGFPQRAVSGFSLCRGDFGHYIHLLDGVVHGGEFGHEDFGKVASVGDFPFVVVLNQNCASHPQVCS